MKIKELIKLKDCNELKTLLEEYGVIVTDKEIDALLNTLEYYSSNVFISKTDKYIYKLYEWLCEDDYEVNQNPLYQEKFTIEEFIEDILELSEDIYKEEYDAFVLYNNKYENDSNNKIGCNWVYWIKNYLEISNVYDKFLEKSDKYTYSIKGFLINSEVERISYKYNKISEGDAKVSDIVSQFIDDTKNKNLKDISGEYDLSLNYERQKFLFEAPLMMQINLSSDDKELHLMIDVEK